MTSLTLPKPLTPGTLENVDDVTSNFTAIRTLMNGGLDGDNLSQATGEALAVPATNLPRRAKGAIVSGGAFVLSPTYGVVARCPTVVVPTAGLLHITLWAGVSLAGYSPGTVAIAIQLNGVIARSRFGVASGASSGLMELTGISLPAPVGPLTGGVFYTQPGDTGLASTISTNGLYADSYSSGFPMGTTIPVVVNAGAYVVDFVAKLETATGMFVQLSSGAPSFTVRVEAF